MNYTHLTIEERCCLQEYYKKGYSYRKIAKLIGRNVLIIYKASFLLHQPMRPMKR